MLRIRNLKLPLEHNHDDLIAAVASALKVNKKMICDLEISKKSLDARKRNNLVYIYAVDFNIANESKYLKVKNVDVVKPYDYPIRDLSAVNERPVIVGLGPAGLFAALILAQAGLNPIVIEQGKEVYARKADIDLFWDKGIFKSFSNVQFGAGGAGTFSDGKLTCGVKDKRKQKLFLELVESGAPKDILFLNKPHVGTDILINCVDNICSKIISLGGEIFYETKFVDFSQQDGKVNQITVTKDDIKRTINTKCLVLAIGHSARDTFELIHEKQIKIKPKSFSVGVRIEHLRSAVDSCQYDSAASKLDAASYKIATHLDNERGVYTFCMCPGGVVVAASSEPGHVVTNGMSYYARDLTNSNSALLVGISPEDYDGENNPLGGVDFQRALERKAYVMAGSNYNAPVQLLGDFLNNRVSTEFKSVIPSYTPGTTFVDLNELFPEFVSASLKEAVVKMGEKNKFFNNPDAVMTGVESRSSSPITILRDEKFMTNYEGIFPCGEGAGYAGGIVSAGIDGMKVAEKIIEWFSDEKF